jgi:ABC-type Fe3+-hydroxamate transport system substrate-binding protein
MSKHVLTIVGLSALAAACASTGNSNLASSSAAPAPNLVAASDVPVELVTADELPVEDEATLNERRVTCREMLQQASNQIVRRCMTVANWRTYDRAQELWAQQQLRLMQGSPYR